VEAIFPTIKSSWKTSELLPYKLKQSFAEIISLTINSDLFKQHYNRLKMKSFVAFAVIGFIAAASAASLTDEQKAKGQEHVKKCLAETKVDPAVVKKLKDGDFSNEDESTQCFALCFLREAGFVDAQGNQQADVIIAKMSVNHDKDKVKAVVDKCKETKGTSPCNKAFNSYKCYRSAVQF